MRSDAVAWIVAAVFGVLSCWLVSALWRPQASREPAQGVPRWERVWEGGE